MPTFNELAQAYAARIRAASARDKTASVHYGRATTRLSRLYTEIRAIAHEIDGLVYTTTRAPLATADKNTIKTAVAAELYATTSQRQELYECIRAASNDNVDDFIDHIMRLAGDRP